MSQNNLGDISIPLIATGYRQRINHCVSLNSTHSYNLLLFFLQSNFTVMKLLGELMHICIKHHRHQVHYVLHTLQQHLSSPTIYHPEALVNVISSQIPIKLPDHCSRHITFAIKCINICHYSLLFVQLKVKVLYVPKKY